MEGSIEFLQYPGFQVDGMGAQKKCSPIRPVSIHTVDVLFLGHSDLISRKWKGNYNVVEWNTLYGSISID